MPDKVIHFLGNRNSLHLSFISFLPGIFLIELVDWKNVRSYIAENVWIINWILSYILLQ